MKRQIEIPDRLYHITKEEFVSSIMADGLIPFKNIVGRFGLDDNRVGIYLTSDWKAILEADKSFAIDGLYLLEVDVTEFKGELIADTAYDYVTKETQFAWYINKVIPPRCIRCLGGTTYGT